MADVAGTRDYLSKSALASSSSALERSRSRRRRRRRTAAAAAATAAVEKPSEPFVSPTPETRMSGVVPVVGAVAVTGRRREMEDTVTVCTSFCSPPINRSLPLHYFGVYDGHGGSHFSGICKQKMHEILKEEVMGIRTEAGAGLLQETWRAMMNRVFERTEKAAMPTCGCGNLCNCDVSYSGTTAVVVVLTEKHYVVANCGDSRAILYRRGKSFPLSFDHKPGRADEKARIEASGGRVVNTDTDRVQGILAMSRAIGDVYLKPYVISEPEVRMISRKEEDEFIILASDGMWDVIPNEMAGHVVHQCLRDPSPDFPASSAAASLLTRLALARNSLDNVSVVVVDLKTSALP